MKEESEQLITLLNAPSLYQKRHSLTDFETNLGSTRFDDEDPQVYDFNPQDMYMSRYSQVNMSTLLGRRKDTLNLDPHPFLALTHATSQKTKPQKVKFELDPAPLKRQATLDPLLMHQLSLLKEDSGSVTNRSLVNESGGELVFLHYKTQQILRVVPMKNKITAYSLSFPSTQLPHFCTITQFPSKTVYIVGGGSIESRRAVFFFSFEERVKEWDGYGQKRFINATQLKDIKNQRFLHATCPIVLETANYLLISGGVHDDGKSVELYSCATQNSFVMPSLNVARQRHSAISLKSMGSQDKCFVFSNNSIEYLVVNTKWKFVASAQKQWIEVILKVPNLLVEPTLVPFGSELVIAGGEIIPGCINFCLFGVQLEEKTLKPVKVAWTKHQFALPVWAYGLPYYAWQDRTCFINSCDTEQLTYQVLEMGQSQYDDQVEVFEVGNFCIGLK